MRVLQSLEPVEIVVVLLTVLQYSQSHLLTVEEFHNVVDSLVVWKVFINMFIVVNYCFNCEFLM